MKPILDNWYVVAIVDKNEVSKLAAKNAIPSAVTLTVVLLVFFMLYMNLFVRVYRTGKKAELRSELSVMPLVLFCRMISG